MRSIQRGVVIVIAGGVSLCSLLLATLWVSAQTIPPGSAAPVLDPPVAVAQTTPTPAFLLTATVGLSPSSCGPSSTVQARANQAVYYCFTITNLSNITLTNHVVSSTLHPLTAPLVLSVAPDQTSNTVGKLTFSAAAPAADVTDRITWTARTSADAAGISRTTSVRIDVVTPTVSIIKTVGQTRNTCATATSLRIPTGTDAFFCLTLVNTGDVTLTHHTVNDPLLGIVNKSFAQNLNPGARLVILPDTAGGWTQLVRSAVNSPLTNSVTLNSYTSNRTDVRLEASATASAQLEVGSTTVQFSKTVGIDPNVCATTPSINVPPGALYYCVTIRNTSKEVTLTHHSLVEDALSINLNFDYPLPPGSVLTVTNSFLAANNQPIVFGPFEFSSRFPAVVNNRMDYTGTSPIGDRVTANGTTFARFADTPTPTRTDRPDPTDTPTPFPTWTPTLTPIPPTPTETPTPTFTPETPTPTPTRSYAISLLETPTPAQPQLPPTPFVDPAFLAVTLTAEAATATAAAAQFGSPLEMPPSDGFFVPAPEQPQPIFESPLETPTQVQPPLPPTPTPALVVVVVTNTPEAETSGAETPEPLPGQLPPGQRPVVPPTATPTPDYVMFAATMLDSFLLTAGWIWFLAGSLIFFVAAGVVAGLFFRQQERRRFDLIAGDLEDGALVAPPPAEEMRPADQRPDDWPDSLP